ncbi:iron-sulfur cluster assembly scaffold protein [Thermodesulfobacteriota bacterium]
MVYERWLNPTYMGVISDPDGYACQKGTCGDTMEIFLKFENEQVKEASYQTDGCGSSNVCGSFAAEMALGKSPDELLYVTGEAIIEKSGGLPKDEEHCAFLAAETLQEALNYYMFKQTSRSNDQKEQPVISKGGKS